LGQNCKINKLETRRRGVEGMGVWFVCFSVVFWLEGCSLDIERSGELLVVAESSRPTDNLQKLPGVFRIY
jgi:hypothetical protein